MTTSEQILLGRCMRLEENEALLLSQAQHSKDEYDMALTLLNENAGGTKDHWNTVVAARLQDKSTKHSNAK